MTIYLPCDMSIGHFYTVCEGKCGKWPVVKRLTELRKSSPVIKQQRLIDLILEASSSKF